MMEEIENVYYRLCSKEIFHVRLEKAEFNNQVGLEQTYDQLICISRKVNNEAFLEELKEQLSEGYEHCNWWLSGFLSDYLKRCSKRNGDTEYKPEYYKDWLENTRFICGNYPSIVRWCDDVEKWYDEYFESINDNSSLNEEAVRDFTAKLLPLIGNEEMGLLLSNLESANLKPRQVAVAYNGLNGGKKRDFLRNHGIDGKTFCEMVIRVVRKEGVRGWSYNNMKAYL